MCSARRRASREPIGLAASSGAPICTSAPSKGSIPLRVAIPQKALVNRESLTDKRPAGAPLSRPERSRFRFESRKRFYSLRLESSTAMPHQRAFYIRVVVDCAPGFECGGRDAFGRRERVCGKLGLREQRKRCGTLLIQSQVTTDYVVKNRSSWHRGIFMFGGVRKLN